MTSADEILKGRTFVTGVAGDDIHVMGIRLVEHALRSAGGEVHSLGVMTPVEEFVGAAQETAADAVVLSSSNGHAAITCDGIRDAFVEAGLPEIRLYIGGNLKVGKGVTHDEVKEQFEALGFDLVFKPNMDLKSAIVEIAEDLAKREKEGAGDGTARAGN